MIQLQNLSCGYGKKVILSNISLSIEKGQLSCLLGKNGAGKTTLFKTVLGLLPLISGQILIEGKALSSYSQIELAKTISYVPQAYGTPFPFSVLDVVLMGQYAHSEGIFNTPGKKNLKIALDCIQMLGIEKLIHKNFSKISGGEKQMVLIARAMAQQPKFIAMDEPSSNLDMGNQIKVMKTVQLLKEQGYGVIMNTHSPEQAMNYADQVILLKDGKLRLAGKPDVVMNSKNVSEIYNTSLELAMAQTESGIFRRVCLSV